LFVLLLLLLLLLCKYTVNTTNYISFNATRFDVLEVVPAKHEDTNLSEYYYPVPTGKRQVRTEKNRQN